MTLHKGLQVLQSNQLDLMACLRNSRAQ
jgi:hypothetical protein